MKILTEKEAGDFLEKKGFDVARRVYIEKKDELRNALEKLGVPWVMKVSGKEIVHKNKLGGVIKDIKDYETALKAFDKLMKIKDAQGVIIQRQLKGKEVLFGIKKTPEFGHVVAFGAGGIHTEELKDVSFRVCPFGKNEARKMIKEVKISQEFGEGFSKVMEKNILKLCRLVKEYPRIKELDINPLMQGKIIDSRIVFS